MKKKFISFAIAFSLNLILICAADIVCSSTDLTDISLNFESWIKDREGEWELTEEGLKVYGTGYRKGNMITSEIKFNFKASKNLDLFVKWKANGKGRFSNHYLGFEGVASTNSFSTHNVYNGSALISEDLWYYTRLTINNDKTYSTITCIGNYDVDGADDVIVTKEGVVPNENWDALDEVPVYFKFGDSYAGVDAYIIIGEVKTNAATMSQCIIVDSDNDGVPDEWDNCPDTPENSWVDKNGCPASNLYTEEQVNQIIAAILSWGDTNGDNRISLSEAINALKITSGITEPAIK